MSKLWQPSRRLFLAGSAGLIAAPSIVRAGSMMMVGVGKPAAGASYVGPGDIVAGWTAWYGLRAFSAAAIGTNAVELRRDSDSTAQSFVTVAGGGLDTASITTFKGAANLFLRTLYDQSGNGRHQIQTAVGNQASFTLSGLGSLPIVTGNSAAGMSQTGTVTQAQPFSVSAVADFTGAAGVCVYLGDSLSSIYVGNRATASMLYAGSEPGTTIANGWHRVQSVFNTTTSDQYIDGVSNSPLSVSTNTFSGASIMVLTDGFGHLWLKPLVEVGMYPGAFSSGNKSSLDSNQQTYWGI